MPAVLVVTYLSFNWKYIVKYEYRPFKYLLITFNHELYFVVSNFKEDYKIFREGQTQKTSHIHMCVYILYIKYIY